MELYKKRKLSFSINSFVLKNTGYKHQSVEVAEFYESPAENGNWRPLPQGLYKRSGEGFYILLRNKLSRKRRKDIEIE